jgi:hypothetical protein
MKKQVKKLELAKETVRRLTPEALGKVAGANGQTDSAACPSPTDNCWSDLNYSCKFELGPTALTGYNC